MAVRTSMAALLARVRILINDPAGAGQQFSDQDIQDVLDEGRQDLVNVVLQPRVTFSGTTIQWLDYYHDLGGWEDDLVLKQWLTRIVTPALSEPIAGHWQFATSTLPPIYITGKLHDVYRAAADLLERWSARVSLDFDFTSDGQTFRRAQKAEALQKLAVAYRRKQRARSITLQRTDIVAGGDVIKLGPQPIDWY